jgi:AI-2 transport protein TqsA
MLAAALVTLIALKELRDLLVPILLAAFLAIISYSITDIMRRHLRFPHWLAVIFTIIVDAGVIYAIGMLIKFLAADMKSTLEGEVVVKFQEKYNEFINFMDGLGLGDQARQITDSPQNYFGTDQIVNLSQSVGAEAISFMSMTTLILILMTFLLGEAPLFLKNFRALPHAGEGRNKVLKALKGIQKYLFIKTIASACTGLLAWWLCATMDVPFAFLWGVVAFVLNYIPTIGSIVAAIPPILLALLLGSWGDTFIVAAGYIGINFMIGNGIEPIFLGKQFGIATSVVLLSVLLWGWVWGTAGMFLAVPISVLIKLALENSRDLYWIAAIIDDQETDATQNLQKTNK